jgi:hypothetical protein
MESRRREDGGLRRVLFWYLMESRRVGVRGAKQHPSRIHQSPT